MQPQPCPEMLCLQRFRRAWSVDRPQLALNVPECGPKSRENTRTVLSPGTLLAAAYYLWARLCELVIALQLCWDATTPLPSSWNSANFLRSGANWKMVLCADDQLRMAVHQEGLRPMGRQCATSSMAMAVHQSSLHFSCRPMSAWTNGRGHVQGTGACRVPLQSHMSATLSPSSSESPP